MVAGVLAAAHWPAQARHAGAVHGAAVTSQKTAADQQPAMALADGILFKSQHPWTELVGRPDQPIIRVKASIVLPHWPAHKKRHHVIVKPLEPVVYLNPLRGIIGLLPERIDMGVDFGGTGPIYAIGNAVITNASGDNWGWPGAGWITYRLTTGPAAGLMVYVAEDVKPTVSVGQQVTASTVIATMFNGGAGIETGWAMPDGASAESQLAVAGGIGGAGPFPTKIGVNFDQLLQALGVGAASNYGQGAAFGLLPVNYPASWASLIPKP
jgi:hypothetical protein